eukprot:1141772-Pelagomonas_calceolata.AAC.5
MRHSACKQRVAQLSQTVLPTDRLATVSFLEASFEGSHLIKTSSNRLDGQISSGRRVFTILSIWKRAFKGAHANVQGFYKTAKQDSYQKGCPSVSELKY